MHEEGVRLGCVGTEPSVCTPHDGVLHTGDCSGAIPGTCT